MLSTLLMFGALGALLIPAECDMITVCIEDDNDLRVDCLIEPKMNRINSYEFSWSIGSKESLINTNVSGSAADPQFRDKSSVVELEQGYRMTLQDYTDKVPQTTTYMCKVSGVGASVNKEKDELVPCSAVSVFLQSSWLLCLLLSFCHIHI